MPRRIHQTLNCERPWIPQVAKGALLSVRMALGSPNSRKVCSKTGSERSVNRRLQSRTLQGVRASDTPRAVDSPVRCRVRRAGPPAAPSGARKRRRRRARRCHRRRPDRARRVLLTEAFLSLAGRLDLMAQALQFTLGVIARARGRALRHPTAMADSWQKYKPHIWIGVATPLTRYPSSR